MYKAIRRLEKIGECEDDPKRGGFFELIELYDEHNNVITKSLCTHPESYFAFVYEGVEYYSLPNSKSEKPVYYRTL